MANGRVDPLNAVGHATEAGADPLAAEIMSSWKRCVEEYGLEPDRVDRVHVLTAGELREVREPVEDVVAIAQPEIDWLFRRLVDSDYIVIFTDANGVAVDFRVKAALEAEARQTGLYLGSVWTESSQGTNGVGTSLRIGRAVSVVQNEHFALHNTPLTCTAVPVLDPQGRIAAVFDIATPRASDHARERLLLEIVRSGARRIESRFFRRAFRDSLVVRLSADPEFIDAAEESLLAIDANGRIIGADQRARQLLGYPAADGATADGLIGSRVDRILRIGEAALMATAHGMPHDLPALAARTGPLYAQAILRQDRRPRSKPPAPARPPERTALDLDALAGGDARMGNAVHIARRLVNGGLPILLTGETGTGKGVFAAALHRSSARAAGPFVPVNCAAIPEGLIEGELFGYRPGAFTGAAREGARGKVLEAGGGTLFLDEIGDMPLGVQTRLLRVLSEGEVTPLGAARPVEVDIAVMAATHQPVESLVAQGRFREDLYHRIAGAVLRLPPLRERTDRAALIRQVFAAEAAQQSRRIALAPDVAAFLEQYPWPGNIRELSHAARYAVALCDGGTITLGCLPDRLVGAMAADPAAFDGVRAQVLQLTLTRCKWNVSMAARMLGISRSTLHRQIRLCRLQRP